MAVLQRNGGDIAGAAGVAAAAEPPMAVGEARAEEVAHHNVHNDQLQQRIDELERLVQGQAERQPPQRVRDDARRDSSRSSSEESSSRERDHRRGVGRRGGRYNHKRFTPQGEQVASFERLMVISMKTIEYVTREGLDISGLIQHITCLAEKASKNIYKVEALISYDAAVRDRAGREGPAAFGVVSQEDVLTYFCYDTTERAKPKQGNFAGGKGKKQANGDGICLKFNRE